MPDTYRVKLSDGRTVRVTTKGGPPSEADVMAQLGSSGLSAAPPPAADDGSFKFNPGESTGHAMLRYGGNELLGAARSPLDLVKGLIGMPGAAWKGLTQDIPTLLRDPSLLTELPGVAADAASSLAAHPTELGSTLAQIPLGAALPKALPAVRGVAGPALTKVGQLVEGAGSDIASHGLLKGLSKAAVSPLAKMAGRGLQRAGTAVDSLIGKTTPNRPERFTPNTSGYDPAAPASDIAVGAPYEPTVQRYTPNEPGFDPSAPASNVAVGARYEPTVQRYAPNEPGFDPSAPASDVAVGAPYEPTVQRYAPNEPGFDPSAPASDVAVGAPESAVVDRYMPNTGGSPTSIDNLRARTGVSVSPDMPVPDITFESPTGAPTAGPSDIGRPLSLDEVGRRVAARRAVRTKSPTRLTGTEQVPDFTFEASSSPPAGPGNVGVPLDEVPTGWARLQQEMLDSAMEPEPPPGEWPRLRQEMLDSAMEPEPPSTSTLRKRTRGRKPPKAD